MSIVKKTVSLSSELVEEAKELSTNFSLLVETALRDYLRHYHVTKALESFGTWQPRDVDSVTLVNDMRDDESRRTDAQLR